VPPFPNCWFPFTRHGVNAILIGGFPPSLHLSQVSDWTFAHNLHPVEAPTALPSVAISAEALQQRSVPAPKADSKYILLVSGLHIGNPPLPTGMLRSGLC
jgi:hypothetical protein